MTIPERKLAAPRIRVGEGWDIHALAAGRPLVLGGVLIPYAKGLLGHSDAATTMRYSGTPFRPTRRRRILAAMRTDPS